MSAQVLPGVGHGLQLEEPEVVSRLVLDFIAGLEGAGGGERNARPSV